MGAYIVCAGEKGRAVVFGYADEEPQPDQPFRITGSRMLLYWSKECGGLMGFAAEGPKTTTRLTHTVMATSGVARQVIAVSEEAAELIAAWPAWVGG